MALSGIADKDIRQELLIRGIVYSCYLEIFRVTCYYRLSGKTLCCPVRTAYKAAEMQERMIRSIKSRFVAKIQRASSVRGFTIEQVVRRL